MLFLPIPFESCCLSAQVGIPAPAFIAGAGFGLEVCCSELSLIPSTLSYRSLQGQGSTWGGRGQNLQEILEAKARGEEEGSSCFEGSMPKELFSGAVLGAVCLHISSLKFREELKETLWQGHKVSTG